ncbi:MAG: hypothetical protein WC683_06155 [bacterium]
MRILAIDPGRHPGYVLLDDAALVPRRFLRRDAPPTPALVGAWWALPAGLRVDAVVTEDQWLTGPQRKHAVLTLAKICGWQLHEAVAATGGTPYVLPVDAWRYAFRAGSVRKEVLQARAEQSLLAIEAATLPVCHSAKRRGDLLDAFLIGAAWHVLRPEPWGLWGASGLP